MSPVLSAAPPMTGSAPMAGDLDAGPHIIDGFSRYSPMVPARHRAKITAIAAAIENSYRAGSRPVVAVQLVGHADRDPAREAREPGYMQRISGDRARLVERAVQAQLRGGLGSRVRFHVVAAGARAPVVANPLTEADRRRNRRVEITLARRGHGPAPRPATLALRMDLPSPALHAATGAAAAPTRLRIAPGQFPATAPVMPTVPVGATALVNGQPSTTVQISWQCQLSGSYVRRGPGGRPVSEPYSYDMGTITTTSGQRGQINLGLLRPGLIVGGSLRITATATVGSSSASLVRTLEIVGENPSLDNVAGMLRALGNQGMCGNDAWALLRVFWQESPGFRQFGRGGTPLIGPPAGVGITQRDPEAAEWRFPRDRLGTPNNFFPAIYWNWQANVLAGIALFRGPKLGVARHDLAALQRHAAQIGRPLPDPCPGIVMRAAIRRYNGGTEYRRVDGPPGQSLYQVHPRTSNPGYVNSVLGHNFPRDPVPPAFQGIFSATWGAPSDLPCPPCP